MVMQKKISYCFFILFFIISANAKNNSVEIISMSKVKSGEFFPVVFRILNENENTDWTFTGQKSVISGEAVFSSEKVSIKKGVGSVAGQIIAEEDFNITLQDFDIQKQISVISDISTEEHAGIIDTSLEWQDNKDYYITGDLTIPAGKSLTIKQGIRVFFAEKANLFVYGKLIVQGTKENPVLFSAINQEKPWGGVIVKSEDQISTFNYCFLINGGADEEQNYGHSNSQPLVMIDHAEVILNDCFLIDNIGKGIGANKGIITISSSLISRCDTGGQIDRSAMTMTKTHILDIPNDDHIFIDDDNDGFYFSGNTEAEDNFSVLDSCVVMTTKDDGIDHNGAKLTVKNSWIEDCTHEGVACSNENYARISNTVVKGCEQGIEAGYGKPDVFVDHCVLLENKVGLRFGDNYDWGPSRGTITTKNSIIYNNDDNIYNYDHPDQTAVTDAIDISYTMTNDTDYDEFPNCFTATPEFDTDMYILPGTPGYGAANDGSNIGLSNGNIPEESVKEYFITCDPADFENIYENYDQDIYIPITIQFKDQIWSDVRLRIRGDSSRGYPKKSLKVKFDEEEFANGRDVLNFNSEYTDGTYFRQYLSSQLMNKTDQPCFKTEHVRLFINGEFFGLYLQVENIDNDFLKERELDLNGNLYKATKDGACLSIFDDINLHWEKKTNPDNGRADLQELIDSLDRVPDGKFYEFAKERFDYEKMVNIIAINILLSNGSTYYHNYYMYHDIKNTGKWTMFPWDMDKSFNYSGLNLWYQRSSNSLQHDNPILERSILCEPILNDIKERIDEVKQTLFNQEKLFPIIDSLTTALLPSVLQDKTDKIEDISQWQENIEKEKNYILERCNYLQNQFDHWPQSFKVQRISDIVTDKVKFTWQPSSDPDGGNLTYRINYSSNQLFPDSNTVRINNISDTTYTVYNLDYKEKYYWEVIAIDGNGNRALGFDSRNFFFMKAGGVIPSVINEDLVLNKENSPYLVKGDVVIAAGASLTVPSGVEIRMAESAGIIVNGEIYIKGTSEDRVIIKADLDALSWKGISLDNAEGNSSVIYTDFINILNPEKDDLFKGAVSSFNSALFLKDIAIDNVKNAVYADNSEIKIMNSSFSGNESSEIISIKRGTSKIDNCTINSSGELDFENCEDVIISNCTITINGLNSNSDAIDIGNSSKALISGNQIFNCPDKGISIGEQSTAIVKRNLIVNCRNGIAVKDGSSALIENNTFYGNEITINCYEKKSGSGGGSIEVVNSILANSLTSAIKIDEFSEAVTRYSLCDTEILTGEGNLNEDPLFVSEEQGYFSLKSTSPCIDSGDPESAIDPDSSRIDIGAFYYNKNFKQPVINEINYISSDNFDAGDWLELYNPNENALDLSSWIFRDSGDGNEFVFSEGTVIDADSFLVICNDQAKFKTVYPDIMNVTGSFDFGLSSKGESVYICDAFGVVADSLEYNNKKPWPDEDDLNGNSIALNKWDLDNSLGKNWTKSSNKGTPGTSNKFESTPQVPEIKSFKLFQNYPNPFNSSTVINYDLENDEDIKLMIFNIKGQMVKKFYFKEQKRGSHSIIWQAGNFVSGVYFYKLSSPGHSSKLKKAILIK